jgi:hypothetical protein
MAVVTATAASSVGQARGLAQTVTNGCLVNVPTLATPSDTITDTGECYKGGKTILTTFTHSYVQKDYGGEICGSFSNLPGRNFTPRITGTFYVQTSFTAAPLHKSSGIRATTRRATLTLGHWQTQCGKLDPANPPQASSLCMYKFVVGGDSCGELVLDNGYEGPVLPRWGGMPMIIGDAVYSPPMISPNGPCSEQINGATHSWMGFPVRFAVWHCPGGIVIAPQVTIYYYPPGSSTVCLGANIPASLGYTVGPANTAGDERFTYFKLPADWRTWGGRIAIIDDALIRNHNGDTLQVHGMYTTIAHEYADMFKDLKGSVDGCSELANFRN